MSNCIGNGGAFPFMGTEPVQFPKDSSCPPRVFLRYPCRYILGYRLRDPLENLLRYPLRHLLRYPLRYLLDYPLSYPLGYPLMQVMARWWVLWDGWRLAAVTDNHGKLPKYI